MQMRLSWAPVMTLQQPDCFVLSDRREPPERNLEEISTHFIIKFLFPWLLKSILQKHFEVEL